jgi:hypothetical protein
MAGSNKLTFARSLKFVFDLIEPEGQNEIAPCWTSSSRGSWTRGLYRSARWHCTAESEIGMVRAKDLSPQARTIQLGGLGRAPFRALRYDTFSASVVADGVARNRDSQAQPARRWRSELFIMSRFVRGDATARL